MKKLICLYLVTAISLALVACNENNESEPGNEGESTLHPDPPGSFETIDVNIPISYDSAPTGTPVGEPTSTDAPFAETASPAETTNSPRTASPAGTASPPPRTASPAGTASPPPRITSPEGNEISVSPAWENCESIAEFLEFVKDKTARGESAGDLIWQDVMWSDFVMPRNFLPQFEFSGIEVMEGFAYGTPRVAYIYTLANYRYNNRLTESENFERSRATFEVWPYPEWDICAESGGRKEEPTQLIEWGFVPLNIDGKEVYYRKGETSHGFDFIIGGMRVQVWLPASAVSDLSVTEMMRNPRQFPPLLSALSESPHTLNGDFRVRNLSRLPAN